MALELATIDLRIHLLHYCTVITLIRRQYSVKTKLTTLQCLRLQMETVDDTHLHVVIPDLTGSNEMTFRTVS